MVVLQSHPADERHFPYWSMAYAGLPNVASRRQLARIGFETAFSGQTTVAGHTVLDLLRNLVGELADA